MGPQRKDHLVNLDQGHPRKWWILMAVSLGMFMALLDVTIVNIAILAMIKDLHTSVTSISWMTVCVARRRGESGDSQ